MEMRIGVMLRAHDRQGGIGIYSRNIIKHLLEIDGDNHYILMYNNKEHLGTYRSKQNVDEIFIPSANPLIWDQWLVPKVIKKWGIDLIFHTKFTVPLMSQAKKIMALHGATWFVHPEIYGKLDLFYVRRAMQIYCRKADFLISNSDLTTRDHIEIFKVPREKIETVHFSAGDEFYPVRDPKLLEEVRVKYKLPDRFILTVTSYDPGKNFGTLLKAFQECRNKVYVHLVVAGENCKKYKEDFDLKRHGLEQFVHFVGWVDQKDLPAIYTLSDVYVFPSIYETFGIPVLEAMSCGCPVLASNTGSIPELCGNAALLSDPFDFKTLAENLLKILLSNSLAKRYSRMGLERAKVFSWPKAAQQTLNIFRRVFLEEISL